MNWAYLLAASMAGAPDVILVTIDTLRVDRLGAYGSNAGATPAIDVLAGRGLVVEEAVVQAPQTRPSHASLLTGLLPFEHGLRDNASPPLRGNIPTLATTLKAAGYATAAFIAAYPVSRASGLDSGFDVFDDPFGGDADFLAGASGRNERPAHEVIAAALAWLGRPSKAPRFVWVHLFEPHFPYEPPPPFDRRFAKQPYDGEVATADAQLKRLLDLYPPSPSRLIVVTSDHGEGLGDHGEDEHHLFVYDTTIRVPLILAGLGLRPGARVRGQFRSIDLMPTVLGLAGVAAPRTTGVSRAQNLLAGTVIPDNESYAESLYGSIHFGYAPVRALRVEGFKYIDTPRPELYRVASDPVEGINLTENRAPLASALRRRLRELHREDASGAPRAAAIDPVALERLAALGYVGGSATRVPAPGASLPDPKDRVDHYHRYSRAVNAAIAARRAGDPARVLDVLAPLTEEFATHYSVVSFTGEALLDLGRFAQAIPYLAKARDLSPKAGPAWGRLAEALSGAGRDAEGLAAIEGGLRASPRSPDLIRLKAAALSRGGRGVEAAAFLEASVKANPKDGVLLAELANQKRNAGDLVSAEALTARAIQLSPAAADAWVSRGLVLASLDRIPEGASAFSRARELDATNVDAWFYGAALEIRRGDGAAALPLLTRAEALDPRRGGLREAKLAAAQAQTPRNEPPPPSGALRLRLIRVSTRTAAEDALRRVTARQDFAAVARAVSIDPTASRGGELGWVVPSDLGEPLKSAVASLRAGEVSSIVETPRGFVIVRRDP